MRDEINNAELNARGEIKLRLIQIGDVLEYLEAGNDALSELIRQQNFLKFSDSRRLTISISIVLLVIQLIMLPVIHKLLVVSLRQRLLGARRILGIIPGSILVRDPRIKRYVQKTSATMIK